jgi:hypothetical protein
MSCEQSSSFGGAIELNEAIGINFYAPDAPVEPPSTSGRRVRLTWSVSRYNFHGTDGIRVRIEAADAELMSDKVFAYLLLPMKPAAGEREGAFSHVCSPTDLAEYPEDEPIPGVRPEFFRLNYVDVQLRSRSEAKAFIQDVTDDVQRLKTTLDIMDTLQTGGSVWIGDEPEPEVSSSESIG